jgi:hypothetical protein
LISNNFVNVQNLFVKLLPFFSKKNRKQEIEEREFFRLMMNMMRSMGNLIWRVQSNDSMGLLSWFVLYWLGYLDCGVNLNGKFNPTALYVTRSTKWMNIQKNNPRVFVFSFDDDSFSFILFSIHVLRVV